MIWYSASASATNPHLLLAPIGWSHLCLFHCRTVSEGSGRGQVHPIDNSVLTKPSNWIGWLCLSKHNWLNISIKIWQKKCDSSLVLNFYINPCCFYLKWVEDNQVFFCEVGMIICDDSNWSFLHLKAQQYLLRHLLLVLSSTRPFQTHDYLPFLTWMMLTFV